MTVFESQHPKNPTCHLDLQCDHLPHGNLMRLPHKLWKTNRKYRFIFCLGIMCRFEGEVYMHQLKITLCLNLIRPGKVQDMVIFAPL